MTDMSFITINHGFSVGLSVRKPQLPSVLVRSTSTCQTSSVASVESLLGLVVFRCWSRIRIICTTVNSR